MGRPWREEYKGGIYNVIARGNANIRKHRRNNNEAVFYKK